MNHLPNLQKIFSDILDNIERETKLKSMQGFSDELESFKQRINDNFFRLAVIGEFSSGKSTFINALIGKDILSHATKETTAVLTRIVNVAENDSRKSSAVAFMKNGQKLSIKDFDELKDYTTAVSQKYQVAKEIEGVEIYISLLHTDRPLMIMDTPGLNGIAEGHLEQTKEIVRKAHACIYLIQQRGLTKDDLEFLRENLIPYQQRFIFVQNFIDEFNASEGENLCDRISYLQKTLTEKVFNDSPNHTFFICGVSALQELVSRDTTIKRLYATDDKDLTEDDRRRLASKSNFASFRKILEQNFSEGRLDEIQYRDTAVSIFYWVKGLEQKISKRLNEDKEIFKTSHEKDAAERIEHLIQKINSRRQDNLMAIRGFISSEIRKLNRELDKLIADDVQEIEQRLTQEINLCSSQTEVEQKELDLSKQIPHEMERLGSKAVEYCKLSFQSLYQPVMLLVEEYSGIRSIKVGNDFKTGSLPAQLKSSISESEIAGYNFEIQRNKSELFDERQELRIANSNVRDEEANVQNLEYRVSNTQQQINQKQSELNRMGSRPAERVWYEEVKRSGIIGWFKDIFSTKREERRDDSRGRAWDNQRRQLEQDQNSLSRQLDDIKKERDGARRILEMNRRKASDSSEKIRRLEKNLSYLEDRVKTMEETAKKEQAVNRERYINMCKNDLRERVRKHFHGDGLNEEGKQQYLLEELKKRTAEGETKLFAEAKRKFEDGIEQKLANLEQARQGNISVLQKKIEGLEQSKRNLEYYAKLMEEKLA